MLPMFYYNSIIKRELAEEAKKVAGRLFTCSAPDVYTGVVFAHLQKKYIHINMPMAVGDHQSQVLVLVSVTQFTRQKTRMRIMQLLKSRKLKVKTRNITLSMRLILRLKNLLLYQ